MAGLSWRRRALMRGAGMVILRPPGTAAQHSDVHMLQTPQGMILARWQPGVDRWLVQARFNPLTQDVEDLIPPESMRAEVAGAHGWRYLRPCDTDG